MRILITGADGFIGSHLAKELINSKNYIFCLDIKSKNQLLRINDLKKKDNFTYVRLDVSNKNIFKNFLNKNKFHTIFHFASIVGVENYIKNPIDVIKFNIESSFTLLETLKNQKLILFFQAPAKFSEKIILNTGMKTQTELQEAAKYRDGPTLLPKIYVNTYIIAIIISTKRLFL